jgi:2,3-bisphosphoglycerate-independent phosphoglycerate mutase
MFKIMKYAILVGDGMADFPIFELDNKTPLEYANTPNMDEIAKRGTVGIVKTIPDGLSPGSDVANLSILGYDPLIYYSGRAPIEAASMGIQLKDNDVAFRCNLVTLKDGIMDDFSAGHIETQDAHQIIHELQNKLGSNEIKFFPGVSYRHLTVFSDFPNGNLSCVPPHDISGKKYKDFLPKGKGEDIIVKLMEKAHIILSDSEINKKRISLGKKPATDIWLWGQGKSLKLPSLKSKYSIRGSVVSAVDLVRGIGVLAGLNVRIVEGATGYLNTNYKGKVEAAYKALSSEDFVYVHVEAPDETSHEGSIQKKIQAIEEFDKNIVGEFLKFQKEIKDLRIMVLPDHATPISLKTHHTMPVPFAVCGYGVFCDNSNSYSEKSASAKKLYNNITLFETFLKGNFA